VRGNLHLGVITECGNKSNMGIGTVTLLIGNLVLLKAPICGI
jgi:hypothetical protein